jgi:hypothetical protein
MPITNKIVVGRPEEKKLVGRPGRSWEGNIKTILKELGW